MADYRFDVRSEGKFKKDIKVAHEKEAIIAVCLCITKHSKTKKWPKLEPAGVDMTGAFIDNIKDVTAEPDFKIDGKLVEITRADVVCRNQFHQKCHKVDRCLENNTDLVFVNGYGVEKQPNYIWLSGEELEPFVIRSKTKYGQVKHPGGGRVGLINKPAYRFDVYWFRDLWKPLPVLIKDIPKEYLDILKASKV